MYCLLLRLGDNDHLINYQLYSRFVSTVWVKHVNLPFLVEIFVSFPKYSASAHQLLVHWVEEGVFPSSEAVPGAEQRAKAL